MQENHSTEEYIPAEYFEVKDDSGFKSKISRFLDSKYFIALLFVLTVLVSFFLGRISGLEAKKVPVSFGYAGVPNIWFCGQSEVGADTVCTTRVVLVEKDISKDFNWG